MRRNRRKTQAVENQIIALIVGLVFRRIIAECLITRSWTCSQSNYDDFAFIIIICIKGYI